jgi:hypothetical protein
LLVLGERLDGHEQKNGRSPPLISPRTDDGSLLMLAVAQYDARRKRAEFVPSALLAEPAWDILLDLYIRQAQGKRTTVSSACVGAIVPATTALRWLLP